MDVDLIADAPRLERVQEEWDALAVDRRRPYCAPAWMLAWWRHVAPADALLRAAVVHSGGEVVGIAPYFADRWRGLARYRLLGAGTSPRREPLARAGLERDVAGVLARTLDGAEPRPDLVVFEGFPHDSPWPALLTESWPGKAPSARVQETMRAPTLTLEGGTYEGWFAAKSAHFRHQARRQRRRLEERGAVFRLATPERLERDLRNFAELHYARWSERGGSGALDGRVESMLRDVAGALPASRFRLWTVEIDGRAVSAHLFVAAGGEVAYWLGGFDETAGARDSAMQAILAAIEHAFSSGDERLDLGAGPQAYKYRFADGQEVLRWVALVPAGPASRRARAMLTFASARRAASERLPERPKRVIKRVLRARR